MSLGSFMDRYLVSCSPSTTVTEAAARMQENDVGAIVVTRDEKPVGILTDRDIVLRCVVRGLDCGTTTLERVMSQPVHTIRETGGIFELLELMKREGIRRVPVVNGSGQAVGIVSFGDALGLLSQELSDLARTGAPETPKLYPEVA